MHYESLTESEADLIVCLSEETLDCVSTGEFTEEAIEEVFIGMMEAYGITAPELEEVIEEFIEEDVLDERKAAKKIKPKLRGDEGEEKDEPKEPVPSEKTPKKEKGLGDILKHALIGAVKQMYKRPEKTKEIVGKGVQKAGKKAVRHLARKGMKMVFGKWMKVGDKPSKPEPPKSPGKKQQESIFEEVQGILDEAKSSKAQFVKGAWERRGVVRMPRIDPDEYPPIRGMEGPFQFRNGRVLYYDPRKGRYYDRKTDMYLSRNEDPDR